MSILVPFFNVTFGQVGEKKIRQRLLTKLVVHLNYLMRENKNTHKFGRLLC
jgi:hypothetical protein